MSEVYYILCTKKLTMLSQKILITIVAIFILHFSGESASPVFVIHLPTETPQTSKMAARLEQMKIFSALSVKEYEQLKGKKLNFLQRFAFKTSQHRMKKMLKGYDKEAVATTLQKISWLLKGILLGPIALLLGYTFLKGDERELIKWIWFGFAGWVIVIALILLFGT